MLNQRINSLCDFGNSISVAATAMTQAVSAKRLIEVPGSSDSTIVTHDPAAEQDKPRRQQRRQPAHVVAHRQRDRQHRQTAERR